MAELEQVTTTSDCCSTEAQATCCEPTDKAACCGESAAGGTCGCSAGASTEEVEIIETHRVREHAGSAIVRARKPA
jgi:arsenite methyltransferase